MRHLLLLLLALAVAVLADGETTYRLRGTITPNAVLSDVSTLATNARAIVNGGEHSGFIRADGSFAVDGLLPGDSILQITSDNYAFPSIHIRIEVRENGKAAVAARYVTVGSEWPEDAPALSYPLHIGATAKYDFFSPRPGFSIVSMFANPYMLMVGASLLMVFILPKLQANMDPEALKEIQQGQAQPSQEKKGQIKP
ncbi:hypothetical protein GGF46_000569 [Coemansia sp. RSA 552]|nr:hypothetical protein GGF46_000569 [Coemansia sp. RSA 552]